MKNIEKTYENGTKNKKLFFALLVLCSLLAILAFMLKIYDYETSIVYRNNLNWVQDQSASCHMEQNHSCAKEFELVRSTGKLVVSVRTITWKKKHKDRYMIVSLWKDNIGGKLVREEKFSMDDIVDQSIYDFTLSNLDLSVGKYVISFTSDEENQPIALAIDRNQIGKQYIRDGNIIENEDLKISIMR
ncbi:MAG: hypothetical protein J6N45_02005 [Alphaproteobacteria bacterium]|nr:hypothetical protein [Alphaproteobacteria bacterium]